LGQSELSIVLTDDNQIRLLNKNYRNTDRPTDVLAFAMREGPGPRARLRSSSNRPKKRRAAFDEGDLLGDVIVSIPTARAQAARRKRDLLSELTMLIAHGTLHLLGWDHDTHAKERLMRAETARLCSRAVTPSVLVQTRGRVGARRKPK
jgi:probable rRNA maturation factor